jgi:hypothetical protein
MFMNVPIECPKNLQEWILKGGAILEIKVYPDRIVVGQ